MFWVQIIGSFIGSVIPVAVTNWQMANIKDICTDHQSAHFTCPGVHTFFTGNLTWGLIGPARMYGSHGIYAKLQWLVLAGFLLPVPFWYLSRRFPKNKVLKMIHIPVIINGFTSWVPYGFTYMLPPLYLAFIFNWWINRRYTGWWLRYNYLLAASFSIGLALSAIFIFFTLQFHDVTAKFSWWGNTVPYAGVDFNGPTLLPM